MSVPLSALLVGREEELGALGQCVDRVIAGRGQVALVQGEPGIGKTRLLQELSASATAQGAQVLWGAAEELEQSLPFRALVTALGLDQASPDPRRARIAELLLGKPAAALSGWAGAEPGGQYRIIEAVLELVESLSLERPVMLLLDDLQWADLSTLLTVQAIARRLQHLAVGVIATFRAFPPRAELDALAASLVAGGAVRMVLGSIAMPAVDELATAVAGGCPGPRLRSRLAAARGNPLFVVELLASIQHEGLVEVREGQAELTADLVLPPDLRATLLRRVQTLPGEVRHLLVLASVLGSRFEVAHLAATAGRSVTELLPALTEAVDAGVLGEEGSRMAFRHDLLRLAIYDGLPAAIRTSLHVEAGRALAGAGAPSAHVAEHLVLGASPGDTEAVGWLAQAANGAIATAPAVAAELLERAVQLAGPTDPRAETLEADLVVARLWSGRVDDAEELARRLLSRGPPPAVESRLRIALIMALTSQERMDDARRESELVVRMPHLPDRARLLAVAAFARLLGGDLDGAADDATEAEALATTHGDRFAECLALSARAAVAIIAGRTTDALALSERAVGFAGLPSEAGSFHSHLFRLYALMEADRFEEATEALRRGRRISEDLGAARSLPLYQVASGQLNFVAGHWDDAVADAQTSFQMAEEGVRIGTVPMRAVVALVALHRNQLNIATEHVARALAGDIGGAPRNAWVLWARALLEEADGDPTAGRATLQKVWDLCTATDLALELPYLGPDLVRLSLATRETDAARTATRELETVVLRMGTTWATVAALHCRGLSDGDPDTLSRAVDMARRSPRPLALARVLEDAGAALSATRPADAVALLEEAVDVYGRLEANRAIARVTATLRSLGVRRGRRGPRARQLHGWESLTHTEREVVELVAQGLTNALVGTRLFISARTVETHLTHVYAKLGLSSRAGLIAEALRRPRVTETPVPG